MNEHATDGAEYRRHLIAYILPFAIFMVMTALEGQAKTKDLYAFIYTAKIAAVCVGLFLGRRNWPSFNKMGLGLGVVGGAIGIVAWIALAKIDVLTILPESVRGWIGGSRTGFDPAELKQPLREGFIAIRFFGLALVVPLMEELFWRGFLIRFLVAEPFQKVPMGTYTPMSFAVVTLLFVAAHPEMLAALVWGAAINLLFYQTKNLWACVAMHMMTNALLGIYILWTSSWGLW
jgi:uncharacterized protein